MEIKETRKLNILYLADHKYGRSALAEKLGYSDTNYLNQLCKGFGNFGNRTARKVEEKLGLAVGWMDILHPELYSVTLPDGENKNISFDDIEYFSSRYGMLDEEQKKVINALFELYLDKTHQEGDQSLEEQTPFQRKTI